MRGHDVVNHKATLIGVVALGASLCCWAAGESSKAVPSVTPLAFLAGHWEADMWGGKFHAYYSTPDGGKVLSHSELRREGKVAFFEFEKFEVRKGRLVMDPFPGGAPATGLMATAVEDSKVVFENPKKDYPTRIVYHRTANDKLEVTLDDPHGGSKKTEVFRFQRSQAPAKPRRM